MPEGSRATNASRSYTRQLHHAIGALLPHQGLRLLPLNDKERWTPRYLVITALLMAIDWAHKKREKPPGDPRCRKATKAELTAARELKPAPGQLRSAHEIAMRNRLLLQGNHHQKV